MTPAIQLTSRLSWIEASKDLFHVCNLDFLDSLSDVGRSLIENGCFLQFLVNHGPERCVALMREINAYMKMREMMFAANHPEEWKEMQEMDEELRLEAEGVAK